MFFVQITSIGLRGPVRRNFGCADAALKDWGERTDAKVRLYSSKLLKQHPLRDRGPSRCRKARRFSSGSSTSVSTL